VSATIATGRPKGIFGTVFPTSGRCINNFRSHTLVLINPGCDRYLTESGSACLLLKLPRLYASTCS